MISWLQHRDAYFLQTFQHLVGAIWYLLRLSHLAPSEVGFRTVLILCGMEKRFHYPTSWISDSSSIGTDGEWSKAG